MPSRSNTQGASKKPVSPGIVEMAPVVAVIVGSSSTIRATPHEPQYR